ncbi:signal recognition particle-docking protein FtsY [Candidatus Woesearchaeota archaeon]|nr:signal recognition particle-docking protein FtsY [Candidatus Woesearchaeota archaeon]
MFGFLKKKIKGALDKFTKKVEEEAPEEEIEVKKEVEVKPEEVKVEEEVVEKKAEKPKEEVKEEVPEEKIEGVKITYFVHGTTTDNEQGLATGWAQGELSELGIEQSKKLPEQVADKKFDVLFCSDLKRAVDSANLGFKDKYKIIQDKRLREANYGDFTQKPAKEFKADLIKYVDKQFPDGESYKEVEKRIAEFLNYLYDNYQGKHVAIIAHQAPQLAMDVLLKGRTWKQAFKEDWRLKKAWQPGWEYFVKNKVKIPEIAKIEEEEIPEIIEEEVKVEEKPVERPKEAPKPKVEPKPEVKEEPKVEEKPKPEVEEEPKEEKKGFFKRITEKITTKKISESKFDELFWDLELAMLENNVAVEVIEKIKNDLKTELTEKPVPRGKVEETVINSLKKSVSELFDVKGVDLLKKAKEKKPLVICFVGINGSGKTTSIAKVAHMMLQNKLSVVMAAADTFRAAAIDQLQLHADKLGVKLIKHDYGSDAAAVAFDAVKHAEAKKKDVVLIDTAGRLHSDQNLVEEMKKIVRVSKPDLIIFVGESITGNDCTEQAQKFDEAVGIDGIILSKADVDEKGGAAISVSYVTKKPILYLGMGQEYPDLEPFDKEKLLASIF